MMRFIFITCFCSVLFFSSNAQDQDFSQFYSLPSFLNPALTGSFNGTYRVGLIYRDQWRSVSTVPINTVAFNGEYRRSLESRNAKYPDYIAGGIKFFTDRTSIIEQNTNSAALLVSLHKSLSQRHSEYLSGGFEIGIVQKNINYEYLNFEDEFNNINNFDQNTAEQLEANNFAYADFSLGLNYARQINKKNSIYTGFTLKHFSTPNVSFWRRTENMDPDLVSKNDLPILYGIQVASDHSLAYRLSVSPRAIVQLQGPHKQAFLGTTFRYDLGTHRESALHMGIYGRLTNTFNESFSFASLTPTVGFEVSDMLIGLSYDIYMADVARNYQGMSTFEVSIKYTGETIEASAVCPSF